MARPLSSFAFLALLTAGGMATAPLCAAQEPAGPPSEMQEKARRTMAIRDALQQVQEARLAYSAKRYTEAVEHYRNALSVLPKAPATQKQEKFIRDSLSDALIARAIDYRSVGRTAEAMEFLREAIQQSPDNQRAKIELAYTEDPTRTNPALSPQHVGEVEEVSRLLTLGYGYLELGKYDDAKRTFRAVLQHDRYNSAASRGLEAVEKQLSAYYRSAHDQRRSAMLAEVGQTWDRLDSADALPAIVPEAQGDAHAAAEAGEIEQTHVAALEGVRIPSLTMEETGIEEAIEILNNLIRHGHSQDSSTRTPINITTDFGARDSEAFKALSAKRITLQMQDVSLMEAISEVARHFGLEYYVVPSGIELSAGEHGERMITRTFMGVGSHIFDREADSDNADNGDDDDEDTGRRVRVRRIDPLRFFKSQGVSFPRGAHIAYFPNSRRLEVNNTRHNLEKIASILNNSGTKEWNVVLNVLVVETDETNIEDLGFDWLFDLSFGNGEQVAAGGTEQAVSSVTGMPLLSTQKHTPSRRSPVVTQGLRSIGQTGAKDITSLIELGSVRKYDALDTAEAISPTIFGVRGVWSAADVTLLMRGLSQKDSTDTLHNPRLVLDPSTAEGVSFTNVREMFIPGSYDPPQIYQQTITRRESADGTDLDGDGFISTNYKYAGAVAMAAGAQPTDFERYGADEEKMDGIGAIVRVHKAEPTADGRQVKLSLTTVINDFEGFIDWGSPIYTIMWTPAGTTNEIKKIFLSPNHIFMPIFKRYTTNTSVTIANGAVLVLGGMREARSMRYEDKVPILGDLPLVGRLFRSEGERRSRRALLVFAKVNIVDPTGRDINSGTEDTAAQSPM